MTRPAEAWEKIKPFAMRDLAEDGGTAGAGNDILILLYDVSTGKIDDYSYSNAGLQGAIAASASGDAIYVPAGTITGTSWTNKSGVTLFGDGYGSILTGDLTNAGILDGFKVVGNTTNSGVINNCLLSNEGVNGVVLTQSAGHTERCRVDNHSSAADLAISVTGGVLSYVLQSKQNGNADGAYINGDANTKVFHSRFIGVNAGLQVETAGEIVSVFAIGGTSGGFRHTTGTCVVSNSYFQSDSAIGGSKGVVLTASGATLRDCGWDSITGESNITYGRGDRGSYSVEDFHAADIEDANLTRHLPQPTGASADSGKVAKLNSAGTYWELSADAVGSNSSTFPGDPYTYLVSEAGNADIHVNPNQYRYDALTTVDISGTVYQAVAFWDSSGDLVIGKRTLDGDWTLYTYDGTGGLADIDLPSGANLDNHDVANIGIDPDGYIHVVYSVHSNSLLYRKSDAAINSWTGGLTSTLSMVGTNETAVTYPIFFNDPSGNLYFLFRQDNGSDADWYFYKYTHGTTTWAAATGTSTGGLLAQGSSGWAYFYRPVFDSTFGSGGFLHFGFQWRTTPVTTGGENTDVSYVRWNGTAFTQADGTSQTVPITNANAEILDPINENEGLTSFNSIYSDSNGKPHLAYQKLGNDNYRHIYHAWHNGSAWTIQQVTYSKAPDQTDHDLHVLVPSILIDRATDEIFIVYVDNWDTPGVLMLRSDPGVYTDWSKSVIYPVPTGWWNPHPDISMWQRSTQLFLLIEFWQTAEGVEVSTGNSSLISDAASFPIRLLKWEPDTSPWQDYGLQHPPGHYELVQDSSGDFLLDSNNEALYVFVPD